MKGDSDSNEFGTLKSENAALQESLEELKASHECVMEESRNLEAVEI